MVQSLSFDFEVIVATLFYLRVGIIHGEFTGDCHLKPVDEVICFKFSSEVCCVLKAPSEDFLNSFYQNILRGLGYASKQVYFYAIS